MLESKWKINAQKSWAIKYTNKRKKIQFYFFQCGFGGKEKGKNVKKGDKR